MKYVGRFNENDIKRGVDKERVEEMMKETGLKYTETKIVMKNKIPIGLDIWVCDAESFSL